MHLNRQTLPKKTCVCCKTAAYFPFFCPIWYLFRRTTNTSSIFLAVDFKIAGKRIWKAIQNECSVYFQKFFFSAVFPSETKVWTWRGFLIFEENSVVFVLRYSHAKSQEKNKQCSCIIAPKQCNEIEIPFLLSCLDFKSMFWVNKSVKMGIIPFNSLLIILSKGFVIFLLKLT